jgi:hypothetical protein
MNALTRGAIIPQRQSKIFSFTLLLFCVVVVVVIPLSLDGLSCAVRFDHLTSVCSPMAGRSDTLQSWTKRWIDQIIDRHRPSDRTVGFAPFFCFFFSLFLVYGHKRF